MIERPVVEFNVTEHCNLKCAMCDHSSPHLPTKFMSLDDFRLDLEALTPAFHVKELRLVGGEPLIHPEIVSFLRLANISKVCDTVTLITNGTMLHRAPEELWDLIDTLIVSVYPGVTLKMSDAEINERCKSRSINLWMKDTRTFRLAVLNQSIKDPELVQTVYKNCALAHKLSCHTVHEGRYYKCSIAPFLEPRFAARGIHFPNRERDGIPIRNNPNLIYDLERYLASPDPLMGCVYCLGTSGKYLPAHQLNKDGLEAEWSQDHSDPTTLMNRPF